MDAYFLHALVNELRPLVVGGRVNKIHQPTAHLLILRLWTQGGEQRLLLDLDPSGNRLGLTRESYPNPFTPPRFCQLMRSRLKRLLSIDVVPGERIVRFVFAGAENLRVTLVAELFGAKANLLLLDDSGLIIDALTRRKKMGGRVSVPGQPYVEPKSEKPILLSRSVPPIPPSARDGEGFKCWLKEQVAPMTPWIAKDLAAEVEQGAPPEEVLEAFRQRWMAGRFSPGIALIGKARFLTAFAPRHLLVDTWEPFESSLEALRVFEGKNQRDGDLFNLQLLRRAIEKGRKKLKRRLLKIEKEKEDNEAFERKKVYGELLLANMHRLRKGMTDVVVDDYYRDPSVKVTIALDPKLSPQENAERYFKSFKKGRRGREHVMRRIEETRQEENWLESLALALDEEPSVEELREISEDLQTAGFLPRQKERADPRRPTRLKDRLRSGTTPSGFRLFWGRNPRTNDYVSRDLTSATDLWFHAHNIPGCHLVLKREGRSEVPEEDLLYAASLAAGYSRGQSSGHVDVMVAEGRFVHKPKAARPGLVTVERYRTLRVVPKRVEDNVP